MNSARFSVERQFEVFARRDCQEVAPLYARLALGIARDPEVLALAAQARSGQPVPTLFLAAVHYLLLSGVRHPLDAFYPSVRRIEDSARLPAEPDPYPLFRAFCLDHRSELRAIVATRLVQTNEVQRCVGLLPAFHLARHWTGGRPLALIEIGASAGLNLCWDRYRYRFDDGTQYGDAASPVCIDCRLRGSRHLPSLEPFPVATELLGIDLHPIDPEDTEGVRWLRALVWPEAEGRAQKLERALDLARKHPPRVLAGDAVDLLPGILAALDARTAACVFHVFTLTQMSGRARARLSAVLREAGRRQPLLRVSYEWLGGAHPEVRVNTFGDGQERTLVLARAALHGDWLQWVADAGVGEIFG